MQRQQVARLTAMDAEETLLEAADLLLVLSDGQELPTCRAFLALASPLLRDVLRCGLKRGREGGRASDAAALPCLQGGAVPACHASAACEYKAQHQKPPPWLGAATASSSTSLVCPICKYVCRSTAATRAGKRCSGS